MPTPSGIASFPSWLAGREIVQVLNTFGWVTEARIWGSLFGRPRSSLKTGKLEKKKRKETKKQNKKPTPLLLLSSCT